MSSQSSTRISWPQISFAGGVNSDVVPTIVSEFNPNGLRPDQIAWANNASVRGGGIQPRRGYVRLGQIEPGGLFQGAQIYAPDTGLPYIICQISGQTLQVRVDLAGVPVTNVTIPGDPDSGTAVINWLTQGEQFLIIQDGTNLPLFWDGVALRRSEGSAISLGVVNANFTVPAVGEYVLVTLTEPFAGTAGQEVFINGKKYQVAAFTNFIELTNVNATPGQNYPALTDLKTLGGTYITTVQASFIAPSTFGGTVVVPVDPVYAGATPFNVRTPDAKSWNITNIGIPPSGANQVYLINITDTPGATVTATSVIETLGELPAGSCMDYYMGRLWVAGSPALGNGREYLAGDIVGSPATPTSGSPQYGYRDSILHVTENSYLSLGGTFLVPTQAGNITAMAHPANLDTALGEGQLIIGTRKNIYSVNVVPQRAAWALLSEPIQRVVQITFGMSGHRSVVTVNGDLFYQSIDGVRSLVQAIRFFQQWGNTALSSEETRAVDLNTKELLLHGSGVEFNQRLLQTVLPQQTTEGVIHKGLMPLDFNPLSSMAAKLPPVWEGVWQGLDFMQVLQADYDGKQRCFAIARSAFDRAIEIWEITDDQLFDINRDGEARIEWSFETPSYTWGNEFQFKQLETMEIWVDKVYGTVDFRVDMRPDQHPCWEYWHNWQICAPRNACDLPNAPVPCNYPQQPYKMQYKTMMTLPTPPSTCETGNDRPINQGYGFQFRITVKGYCRIRGIMVHAVEKAREPFANIQC